MSKNKKRKWWQIGSWAGNEVEEKFSNTIAQHSKNIERRFDEDGFEILAEDDLSYHENFEQEYGWGRKLQNQHSNSTKKEIATQNSFNFNSNWDKYSKTGNWSGYSVYKEPTLSYRYVQQMANALSAQHMIKVSVGMQWEVNLLTKSLVYNPGSLIYGTKGELLATLMHEIGKLRYMEHSSKLTNRFLSVYGSPAKEVLSCFEDVRVDYHMLKAYESAGEIYESAMPAVEKQAEEYERRGVRFEDAFAKAIRKVYELNSQTPSHTMANFGTAHATAQIDAIIDDVKKDGNINHYCAEMLRAMYDLDTFGFLGKKHPRIKTKVEETIDAIEPAKKHLTSQMLVDWLDGQVYTKIEPLLKDFNDQEEKIKEHLPNITPGMLNQISALIKRNQQVFGEEAEDKKGNSKVRNSGPTQIRVPPEWFRGDYKVLKDTVIDEIRQLINKLTFLRREEMTVRYEGDQKRGKLNMKRLYKSALGSRRLFKKKLENTDTIQSFAFSVLMDVSGSMQGERLVHTTRALIIFAEVFKKLSIPFELVIFDDDATHIKKFDDGMTTEMQKKIGGLVSYNGGGTNLRYGLDALKIHQQPESNKIVIVLTDGGVGDIRGFDNRYFIPWAKKGIKSIGIGIECEASMAQLCMGNSKVLKSASEMPVEFAGIIKSLIKRK